MQRLTLPHSQRHKIQPYHVVSDTEADVYIYLDSQDVSTVCVGGGRLDLSLTVLLGHLHCYTCVLYLQKKKKKRQH